MLRYLFGFTGHIPRPPSMSCPILQLPIDLILLIADQLPPAFQVVLSETCRSLHTILLHHRRRLHPLDGWRLTLSQHMAYLACRARDPEWWACKGCKTLHRVTDETLQRSSLPRDCSRGRDSYFFWSTYGIDHHHVQLALKYTRLNGPDKRYQPHLDRLLAPRCESHEPYISHRFVPSFKSHFRSRHGVVKQRYLLFSVREYQRFQPLVPLSFYSIDCIQICPHLSNRKLRFTAGLSAQELACASPRHALTVAMRKAFDGQGDVEMHGSCPYCTTDFTVRASSDRLVLRCWHDLGSEGHRSAEIWSAIANHAAALHGPFVSHVPGSVRALFAGQEGMEDMVGEWV